MGRNRGPMSADDTIRDLFRNHSKKDLIEVIVAQTQAAVDAEKARPEQDEAVRHPRTYSLVGTPHLFLVTDDESGINIGYANKIGGPLVALSHQSEDSGK